MRLKACALAGILGAVAALGLVAPPAAAAPRSVPTTRADALVGGHVIVAPGRELDRATIIVRDGVIEAVGVGIPVPADARRWDMTGFVLYPGLIDAHLGLSRVNGIPAPAAPSPDGTPPPPPTSPEPLPARRSATGSANPLVHPEVHVADVLAPDAKALEALRSQGFAAACVVPDRGILRGRDAVVSLRPGAPGELVVREGSDLHAAFEVRTDGGGYPDSVMGATALLRQSLLDGEWYARARAATASGPHRIDDDAALAAIAEFLGGRGRSGGRLALASSNVLDDLRAARVASEFGLPLLLKGSGDEYRRLADVAALKVPIIVPVAYPAPPLAVDESEWDGVSLEQLRHWKRAPDNARWLADAGVEVSLTTDGLTDAKDFLARLRRSLDAGLEPDRALAMLTTNPAKLLGMSSRLGSLERGRIANIVVSRGRPFGKTSEVREVWVDGRRQVVSRDPEGPLGAWTASLKQGETVHHGTLTLSATGGSFAWDPPADKGKAPADSGKAAADPPKTAAVTNLSLDGNSVRFDLEGKPFGREGVIPFAANVTATAASLVSADGAILGHAERKLAGEEPPAAKAEPGADKPAPPAPAPRPVGGPLAQGADVLLANATVWTSGEKGILGAADVLVRDGKIAAIGSGLARPSGVPVIECAGLHVTPGLIDAHNHSAIVGGVNEGTNSCTAEVRIGDVVNSETIDIYRQLAGGLTACQLLHGSANCMGGQSQVIKLRWGANPEGLKFKEARPTIKFALGENVKQSNWGEKYVTRYPQTRLGVEQFMREKFAEARDWETAMKAPVRAGAAPPRRDLQLETLDEILRGARGVHCHSYRQDEILMLMRVAEEMGFRIDTFQHILEGYKVADEMAKHGARGSSFTDWWAYKFEVYDAIPYNPALMAERGVVVSVNSDSTELARRMNLEAAKVAKWGNVPPAEALKFVTINPAKQLGVDSRTGSVEVGKDADLVVWSADPLSTASRALRTYVDGKLYFDRDVDVASRAMLEAERRELIGQARKAREGEGAKGEKWAPAYLEVNDGCMDGHERERP